MLAQMSEIKNSKLLDNSSVLVTLIGDTIATLLSVNPGHTSLSDLNKNLKQKSNNCFQID